MLSGSSDYPRCRNQVCSYPISCPCQIIADKSPYARANDESRNSRPGHDQGLVRLFPSIRPTGAVQPSSSTVPTSVELLLNEPDRLLTMSFPSLFEPLVHGWDDIVLPTKRQSLQLVEHSKVWTAWIHCAICYRDFEPAHQDLLASLEAGNSLKQHDPSWLAIYFAILAVRLHRLLSLQYSNALVQAALLTQDEDDVKEGLFVDGEPLQADVYMFALSLTSVGNLPYFMRMWYSASVFCLERAGFMRNSSLMTVQAIGILQMSANAVGDHIFRTRMMAVGIQIANDLGMPFQTADGHSVVQAEYSRRLWWVFVICEWYVKIKGQKSFQRLARQVPLGCIHHSIDH
jgi:hypothetical protein